MWCYTDEILIQREAENILIQTKMPGCSVYQQNIIKKKYDSTSDYVAVSH